MREQDYCSTHACDRELAGLTRPLIAIVIVSGGISVASGRAMKCRDTTRPEGSFRYSFGGTTRELVHLPMWALIKSARARRSADRWPSVTVRMSEFDRRAFPVGSEREREEEHHRYSHSSVKYTANRTDSSERD